MLAASCNLQQPEEQPRQLQCSRSQNREDSGFSCCGDILQRPATMSKRHSLLPFGAIFAFLLHRITPNSVMVLERASELMARLTLM
jgi:hypothetical protein